MIKQTLEIVIMYNLSEILSGSGQENEMQETNSYDCSGRNPNHQISIPESKIVYQCSMKCELDKTYDVPGNCPVCNVNLEQGVEERQKFYL
jgi:hypothetical protein